MLAVVAGLTLSGVATLCHDVWTNVVRHGTASEAEQLKVARIATVAISVLAIVLGITFEGQNVAFMAGLAFPSPVPPIFHHWSSLSSGVASRRQRPSLAS
ncbi:Na+(H+)/acetate symporter ActP [Bradyrhizobium sp. GM22.5]